MAEQETDLPNSRISIEVISKLVKLKVIKSYLSDFLEYGRYDYEEATYVKQNFIDNNNKEVNGIPRKNYEMHVYSIRKDLHDRFLSPDFNRIDEIKLIIELSFKLSKLAQRC